ncbi:unnamed protein product [Paramecium sonneborni]|uniref:Transmembrane protein n=1 Tax=Paramecium sonneborni TaxID=65129 RepID=A0A8S1R6U8_9CILI|nr:unnamed protein product [Paramecium sonneborni]
MSASSVHQNILISNYQISIINYDSVEIKNIIFTLHRGFILENTNKKVDITLKNVIFIQSNFSDETIIKTQQYDYISILIILPFLSFENNRFQFQLKYKNQLLISKQTIDKQQQRLRIFLLKIVKCSILHFLFLIRFKQ